MNHLISVVTAQLFDGNNANSRNNAYGENNYAHDRQSDFRPNRMHPRMRFLRVSSQLSGIPKFVCFPLFPHGLFTSLYQIPQREADARNRIPGIDGSPYLREPSTAPPFLRPP